MFISVYKYIICRYKCFISVLFKCVICRYKYFISGYKCFKVVKVVVLVAIYGIQLIF